MQIAKNVRIYYHYIGLHEFITTQLLDILTSSIVKLYLNYL